MRLKTVQTIDEMNDVQINMMWVWGDRARSVVEIVLLHSLDNIGVLGMYGGFTLGMSIHPENLVG